MSHAAQCLQDRIRVHVYERARLVALRNRLEADDQLVANLSAVIVTPALDLADPTIRTHTNHHQKQP